MACFTTNIVYTSSDEVCTHCNCRKGRHCNSFCPSRDGKGFTQKCFAFSGKYRTSKCDKNRNPKQYGRYARTYPQRRPQGGRLSGATFPNERAHDLASTAQVDRARPAASETRRLELCADRLPWGFFAIQSQATVSACTVTCYEL